MVRRIASTKTHDLNLAGVAETLLIPLYVRALETKRPDSLLRDDKALALVTQYSEAFAQIKRIKLDEHDKATLILRNKEFDHMTRAFLEKHAESVVVHIGCGLDTRFERVDNGRVQWYDLDLPQVITLRRKFIGGESRRYHLLACSVFDDTWINSVLVQRKLPVLFLAEGVFMYFAETQVKSLVLRLREKFPGAQLVFDAFSPFIVHANNFRFWMSRARIGARYQWGLHNGKILETWGEGIRLVETWYPFDRPEPRLARIRWMRRIPLLAKVIGIYCYQLGSWTPSS